MPLLELGNGKTVEVPIEMYLLDDKEFNQYLQLLIGQDQGFVTQDYFHDSSISHFKIEEIEEFPDDKILLNRDDI